MARPKKSSARRKTTYFRFRLTESEKQLIDDAAVLKSLDSSAWARSELLAIAKKIASAEKASST